MSGKYNVFIFRPIWNYLQIFLSLIINIIMLVTWQASFTYDDQLALNVTELDPAIFE